MADVADYTQAVNVTGGSVSILGTATVSISGTPAVSISGIPAVSISGTPAVTINSGSVSAVISGTPNINIAAQSVTLATSQPMTALADLSFPVGTSTQTTAAVPAGTHALALSNSVAGSGALQNIMVKGHTTGTVYYPLDLNNPGKNLPAQGSIILPVNSVTDTQYDITGTVAIATTTIKAAAVLDSESVIVQNSPMNPVYVAVDVGLGQNPLPFQLYDGARATYRAAVDFTPAAAATDVFVLGGSATKTIRVTFLSLVVTASTIAEVLVSLIKRSSADTVGTPAAVTRTPLDSNDPASAADVVAQSYSANPTVGATIGAVGRRRTAATAAGTAKQPQSWEFGGAPGARAVVLRGVAQQLAVNLSGATLTGGEMSLEVEWTEE